MIENRRIRIPDDRLVTLQKGKRGRREEIVSVIANRHRRLSSKLRREKREGKEGAGAASSGAASERWGMSGGGSKEHRGVRKEQGCFFSGQGRQWGGHYHQWFRGVPRREKKSPTIALDKQGEKNKKKK